MKLLLKVLAVLGLGLVAGIIGFLLGADIGGNQAMGYESGGTLGLLAGGVIGLLAGGLWMFRRKAR